MPTFYSFSRKANVRFDEVHPLHLANAANNFGDTALFNAAVEYLKSVFASQPADVQAQLTVKLTAFRAM